MADARQQLIDFNARYSASIELFVREVLRFPNEQERSEGKDIYPWQLRAMADYDARVRLLTIKSGHGVGKTTLLDWVLWHHLLFRYPQRTAITAPTEKQLYNVLWNDFKVWGQRLPIQLRDMVEITSDRAELKRDPANSYLSLATARADQPEALQGVHCNNGFVLLLADEASGVSTKVFNAGAGSMSGHNAMTILTGNPLRADGYFFDTHNKLSEIWTRHTASCLDIGGVSDEFVKQIELSHGRDSNEFRVRVLGEFPVRDDDTVIPWDLVNDSLDRDIILPKTAPVVWGLDCARFGSDRSALAKRQTKQLLEKVKWWVKLDTMELASRIKHEYDTTPQWLKPLEINVDAIGIGAGVVDRLRQLELPARGINVSESPASVNADKYSRLRDELWFKALDFFQTRDCKLPSEYGHVRPNEDDLVRELTTARYKYLPASGKIKVESKDEMRKRGMRSPDLADAFILTFASDAIALSVGSVGSTSWKRKLSRPLQGGVLV